MSVSPVSVAAFFVVGQAGPWASWRGRSGGRVAFAAAFSTRPQAEAPSKPRDGAQSVVRGRGNAHVSVQAVSARNRVDVAVPAQLPQQTWRGGASQSPVRPHSR